MGQVSPDSASTKDRMDTAHSATNRSETKIELLCSRGPLNPATYEFHSHLYHNQANFSQFQKFWVKSESWSSKMGKNSTKNPLFERLKVIEQVRPEKIG